MGSVPDERRGRISGVRRIRGTGIRIRGRAGTSKGRGAGSRLLDTDPAGG
jgi:hypothetical protein